MEDVVSQIRPTGRIFLCAVDFVCDRRIGSCIGAAVKMSIAGIALLCSLAIPMLAAIYWHWRVYGLYRMLGGPSKNISYYWFSFQFQNPRFARQLPGYVELLDPQTDDLKARIVIVRLQMRYATYIMVVWILFAVILFWVAGRNS